MRILMLHGYAQTGDTFRRKLRRLENAIRESHPDASFVYLDGPMKLDVDDMTESKPTLYGDIDQNRRLDLRAWFRLPLVEGCNPPTGLSRSLDYLATALEHCGPFDGIIAFSQGTVLGGLICSLLQDKERSDVIDAAPSVEDMQRPKSFLNIKHPPIKFGVFYASRVLTGEYYDWLYEAPRMNTSFCHFFGLLDSMVGDEEQDEVTRVMCRAKTSVILSSWRTLRALRPLQQRNRRQVYKPTHGNRWSDSDENIWTPNERAAPQLEDAVDAIVANEGQTSTELQHFERTLNRIAGEETKAIVCLVDVLFELEKPRYSS